MTKKQPNNNNKQKMFVIRKYIMATSAKQAILKDRNSPVDDVWVDSDWQKKQTEILASAIGFAHYPEEEYD